ncbi:MAG: sugar phosphate isomerase/epimerase family protein [Lacipirellulaceae bacterium]
MPEIPIAVQTRSLRLPLREALATAARLGASGVEIDARNELRVADFSQTALRQLRKLLDDLGLRVASVAFPTRRTLADTEDLERRVLAIREAMTFAYKIGARVLAHPMPDLPPLDSEAEPSGASKTFVESLSLLADHGDRAGARVALASGADPAAQRALLDSLPDGTVGVALHPGALVGRGHDPAAAAGLLGDRVLLAYAADATCEGGAAALRGVETQLGRGDVDLPAVAARLEEHGYRGWFVAERREGPSPAEDLGDSVAYLNAL